MTTGFNTDGGIHEIPLEGTVGKLFLCGKHFIGPDVEAVRTVHNIEFVVCLVEEHELVDRYDDYVQWHRHNAGNPSVWFPIHDLTYPPLDDAIEFVEHVTSLVRDKGNMVVHCAAGIGRAGTTATAILMMLGMPMHEATAHVRAHRPMAGPESGGQEEFIRQLDEYIREQGAGVLG
jgi:protein-tyrosine phosphatase